MAGKAELGQILKKLQESSGNPAEDALMYKEVVCQLVHKSLTDIDKVSDDLCKVTKTSHKEHYEHCLKFISHCVGQCPQIFAAGPIENGGPATDDKEAVALTSWLVSRLIRLTSQVGLRAISGEVQGVLVHLLHAVQPRDPALLRNLLTQTVKCLHELAVLNQSMYDEDDQLHEVAYFCPIPGNSKDREESTDFVRELQKNYIALRVTDIPTCELIQSNIGNLLYALIQEVCQYLTSTSLSMLWTTLCCELEYGEIDLKMMALRLTEKLLQLGSRPQLQVLDYYVCCMTAMLELLLSGCDEVQGDYEELERRLSSTLNHVVSMQDLLAERHYRDILSELSRFIYEYDIEHIRTSELKQGLFSLITILTRKLPDNQLQNGLVAEHRSNLVDWMITKLGVAPDVQNFVPVLVEGIALELRQLKESIPTDLSSTRVSVVAAECKTGKKRKLTNAVTSSPARSNLGSSQRNVVNKSASCNGLINKLNELCDILVNRAECDQDDVVHVVKGLKVIIEVISVSAVCWNGTLMKFLDLGTQQKILESMKKYMQIGLKDNVSTLPEVYHIFVETIGIIVLAQDVLDIGAEMWPPMTWMLSLNWLPNEVQWLDLKPVNNREVVEIAKMFAEKINLASTTIGLCVLYLCHIPKDISPRWRTHVLKVTVNDSECEVQRSAVKGFPFLLHHAGPNANHLVYDLLHELVRSRKGEILTELASLVGPLACIVSRKASLVRGDPDNPLNLKIQCCYCDEIKDGEESAGAKDRPKIVDPAMFKPFIQLLHQKGDPKDKMVRGLHRILGHLGLKSSNTATMDILNECLKLVEDPDYNVRIIFSEAIKTLVRDSTSGSSEQINKIIMSHIFRTDDHSRDIPRFQETLVLTMGQLGRAGDGELLLLVLVDLVKHICSPTCPLVAAVARREIVALAAHKNIPLNALITEHRKTICDYLVDTLHNSLMPNSQTNPHDILQDMATIFKYEDVKDFIQSTQKYMLPYIVGKATKEASQLIRLLAKEIGDRYKSLLARNVKYIFSYVVRICTKTEDLQRALTFLQNETDVDLGRLLRYTDPVGIMNELLLHLSTHYNQVFKGLNLLVSKSKDETIPSPGDISTREQLANYIQPRLLAILVFFDNQLLNNTIPLDEKKQALGSIVSIMELLGPQHITAVRLRIMTTLRNSLQLKGKGFAELSCRAWNKFVHSVNLTALGPMLPQIIVNLMGLLKELPGQVAEILNFLIVENRNSLNQHFCDLYFIPEMPELADVHAVLKKHNQALSRGTDFGAQIEHLLRGLAHESLDVKRHALLKLKMLLHNNQASLQQLILSSETVDPVLSKLVSMLLDGCRERDERARSLCGECLGEIGAIDPGRLELMTNNPKEELTKFKASVTDENFVFDLVNELAKAFLRAKETTTQDCVAFGLQEILQSFDIREDTDTNSPGSRLWKRFDEDVQEILTPLLQSRYLLHYKWDWSNLETPIYGSRKCAAFPDWVCALTGYLGSKVEEAKPRQVFEACRGVIKHDSQIALYLLPHVVVHALMDSEEEGQAQISKEMLAVLNDVRKPASRNVSASDFRHMTAQTVFSLLDHLTKWTRHRVMILSLMSGRGRQSSESKYTEDRNYQCIRGFLDKIPQDVLAHASFNCKAYTRALMHLETYMRSPDQNVIEHLDFLQKLYLAMDEPDGVAGVTSIKQSQPTLAEEVLAHESLGQMADASACYDRAIQLEPDDVGHFQGLLKSFMNLGQLSTSMELADGVSANNSGWTNSVNAFRVEAAWKLGQWDKLERYLKKEDQAHNWNIGVGRILLAAKYKNDDGFARQIETVRSSLMGPLSAASMEWGSYQRGYEFIVRLHMLNELEKGVKTLLDVPVDTEISSQRGDKVTLPSLLEQWQNRTQLAQTSFRTQEPIIQLRRSILNLAQQNGTINLDNEIGKYWLEIAKVARQAGHLQTSYTALLTASGYNLQEFCIEKAKYLWEKGNYDQAQVCLENAIEDQFPDRATLKQDRSEEAKAKKIACAKILLELGRYREETASLESNAIVKQYKEVTELHTEWEDGYFYCAKYYDKIMTNLVETERPEKRGEFVIRVVQNFGLSLVYGNQYIYQSMPRLLTLWTDYGAQVSEQRKNKNESVLQSMSVVLSQLNKTVETLVTRLAPYQFLTAFPQLISRICHSHSDVFQQLLEIIAQMLVVFPQQAMWMMMAVSKSTYQMRVKRCQEIFTKAKLLKPDLNKFLLDSTKLTDRLLDLCNKQVEPGVNTLNISIQFKALRRLIDDKNFSQILLPLESLTTVTLPTAPGKPTDHDPFPGKQVHIQGFEDTVEVLASLQKPKKITLRGTDGKFYIMLCKPKDDLRKDNRLMEFNGIINKCLRKDPESRKRGLRIRTYTVTPLNEECGMLEWVSNTHGLRNILMKLFKERGIYTSGQELRSLQLPVNAAVQRKLDVFKNKLIPRHPPLFREWFLKTFPDPTSWYNARIAYCRTTAVMSMVGYILGLGDRHGENILMDSVHGDCVHVDFNCLFNKGETFDYPEIVPFRLTHNMIEAMGPMGVEGIFRRACEVALRVMRDQSDPLMSVLKTFIYDPLVEWSKPARGRSNVGETGEIKNEKAYTSMMNVESRLKGVLKNKTKPRGLPLSVEGHVNHLIQEATDERNLCQMYIGWAAYL